MNVSCKSHLSWFSYHHEAGNAGKFSIGILTFEVAAAMARLVSIHRTLSEVELRRFRTDTLCSPGVAYLTSTDHRFLFRLACTELLSDLDSAASTVSRLSTRCNADHLLTFPRTYAEVKSGCAANVFIETFSIKGVDRQVGQMDKWIAVAMTLFEEMEVLSRLEAEEKVNLTTNCGRLHRKQTALDAEMLREELKAQRKMVARLKEESLWCKSFNEAVAFMSRSTLAIFAKICSVFSPFVPGLPPIQISGGRMSFTPFNNKIRVYPMVARQHHGSDAIETGAAIKEVCIRNSCTIIGRGSREAGQELPEDGKEVFKPEAANTVGGSGMDMQYASVVILAEKLMRIRSGKIKAEGAEGVEEGLLRDGIYRLLPANLKAEVRRRLRDRWEKKGTADGRLAEGWREAAERILRWLGPVARDTVMWHEERTLDRRQRLCTRPRVLAVQTLIFSDREKTEVAIVEVLVGLSCNCWYDGLSNRTT